MYIRLILLYNTMKKCSEFPLVTVCIPIYGRPEFLYTCINSVIYQTYTNLEILLIYTESNDNTLDILKDFASKDSRIKILSLKDELGITSPNLSKSTELGYNKAQGKYICTVDSDDYITSNCIEECINNIEDYGLIYTYCRQFGDINVVDKRSYYPYSKEKLLEVFMVFQFRLFLKEAWDKIGELSNLQHCQDYDLVLRLSEVTTFKLLPKQLYYWRRHNNQQTSKRNLDLIKECRCLSINNAKQRRGLL